MNLSVIDLSQVQVLSRHTIRASRKDKAIRWLIYSSLLLLAVDFLYKSVAGISLQNREACIFFKWAPKIFFLVYEYVIELAMIVLSGIFLSVVVKNKLIRYRSLLPRNPVTAFLYASVLPVCSCSVIPVLGTLRGNANVRTLITFVMAAPLLNPYIIVLSFTVLGPVYGVLRIAGSFVLAVSAGYMLEIVTHGRLTENDNTPFILARKKSCSSECGNLYQESFSIFKKVLPYLLIAGTLGLVIEFYDPVRFLYRLNDYGTWTEMLMALIIGIPVYLCNGADIVILNPFLSSGHLTLGTALVFSFASTSVCISSFILLIRYLGKMNAVILLLHIIAVSLTLGLIADAVMKTIII